MIISEAHRFIFIAVPKTASSSIETVLREHGQFYAHKQKHLPAAKVKMEMVKDWESYRSFAVIRHPVDWLHSWYKFWSAAAKDPKTGVARHNRLENISFVEFVSRTIENRDRPWTNVGTQAGRVCDDKTGKILVSRLLSYDHLAVLFPKTLETIGLPVTELPEKNISKLQEPLPVLPAPLMNEVRRHWHHDFVLYSRAYYDFAKELSDSGQPVPPPKFELLPPATVARDQFLLEAEHSLASGQLVAALATIQNVVDQYGESGRGADLLAECLAKSGNMEKALDAAQRAVSLAPQELPYRQQLAQILGQLNRVEEAASVLASATPREAASFALCQLYRTHRKPMEAIAIARQLVQQSPAHPDYAIALAELLQEQEKVEDARQVLRGCLDADTWDARPLKMFLELGGDGALEQAVLIGAAGVTRCARKDAWYQIWIDALVKLGRLDEAKSVAYSSLRHVPKGAKFHYTLGDILARRGQFNKAKAHLEKAASLAPQNKIYQNRLTRLPTEVSKKQKLAGKPPVATTEKPRVVAANEPQKRRVAPYQNGFDSGIAAARNAIQQRPDDAQSHFRLGSLLLRKGKLEGAAEALRRAISLDPSPLMPYRLLSAVLLRQGDVEQAVALAREAVARKPNRPELLKHLAHVLRKQGRVDEAAAVLRRTQAAV